MYVLNGKTLFINSITTCTHETDTKHRTPRIRLDRGPCLLHLDLPVTDTRER